MKPYYQDELVTLYHADLLNLFNVMEEADVLVTDPPYGLGYTGFTGRKGEPRYTQKAKKIKGDKNTHIRDTALEAWGEKPAIVFGKWTIPKPENTRQRLIWDKRPCGYIGDYTLPWGSTEEEIYIIGKGFTGKREPNVINVQTLTSASKNRPNHPTPKPVPLMEKLLEKCPPEWTILDPFAGSGATLIAARNLGRKAIGIEIEEEYCNLATSLLNQGNLF